MKIWTVTLIAAALTVALLGIDGAKAEESNALVAENPTSNKASDTDAVESSVPAARSKLVASARLQAASGLVGRVQPAIKLCRRVAGRRLVSSRGVRRGLRGRGYRWIRSVHFVSPSSVRIKTSRVSRLVRCTGYYVSIAYRRGGKYKIYSSALTGRPFARRRMRSS